MAGLKFGSIFNDIGAGFEKSVSTAAKNFADATNTSTKTSGKIEGIKSTIEDLKKLSSTLGEVRNVIKANEKELEGLVEGTPAYIATLENLNEFRNEETNLIKEEIQIKKDLASQQEDLLDLELQAIGLKGKHKASFQSINKEYEENIKLLREAAETTNDYQAGLEKLKEDMFKKKIMNAFHNSDDALKEGMGRVSNEILGSIAKVAPELAPIMALLEDSIGGAFKQVVALNESLIQLQRATGGMITASRLGYDAFGNSTTQVKSLSTSLLAANVDMENFSKAMESLASDGFGQTMGAANNLKNSQIELAKYGIEAARAMKLYGADLGPSVRNLFQNFGVGIGQATDLLSKGADKAKLLGLNAKEFINNFAAVTALVGDVYFKTTEEMSKMAMISTQLGVTVGKLAHGMVQMTTITDLFSQQQKTAALGLDTTARALSKIYALRKQGKGAEAVKIEVASIATDLKKAGMIGKEGTVTTAGLDTLKAAGIDQEAIAGIQKMALQAERTGISLNKLGDISQLSALERVKLAKDEAANITLQEQFAQITGLVKQSFIDPFAQMFGPALKNLMNVLVPIVKAFSSIMTAVWSFIDIFLGPMQEISNQIFAFFADILNPFADTIGKITEFTTPLYNILKQLGVFIVKTFFMPLRMLGTIVGGLFTAIGNIVSWFTDLLSPAIKWVTDGFVKLGEFYDNILDNITAFFSSFMEIWNNLKDNLSDAIHNPPLSIFFGGKEKTSAVGNLNGKTWDEILGVGGSNISMATPTIPTVPTNVGNGPYVAAPSTTIENAKETNNILGKTTNVVVNTTADATFGSKQSVKLSV
jgi:phage-related protein